MTILAGETALAEDFYGIKMFRGYFADAGANDSYEITASPVPTEYNIGDTYIFKANTANTGSATLNVNSLGAKTIKKFGSSDLVTGDILAGQAVTVVYDGTNFQVQGINQPVRYAHGNITRGIDDATTTTTVSHNLGTIPKIVRMFAGVSKDNSSGDNSQLYSIGSYIVSSGTYRTLIFQTNAGSAPSSSSTVLASVNTTVTISNITSTQMDITLTKNGSPFNNDTAQFNWEVEG